MPPLDGASVAHWPEFRAFWARLGLAAEVPAEGVLLSVPQREDVGVFRGPMANAMPVVPTHGHEVYSWPEFRALCRRLGIAWQLPTIDLILRVVPGEFVRVTQVYQPCGAVEGGA